MARLTWDEEGRPYEYGVDRGVFYPKGAPAKPWNGLISVKEAVTGDNDDFLFVDGVKLQQKKPTRQFRFVLESFGEPEGFAARKEFGLCYRTMTETGYKLHLIYNALPLMPAVSYDTLADGTEVVVLGWDLSARPEIIPDAAPTAHLVVDTAIGYSWMLEDLENALYGSDSGSAYLPSPAAVLEIVERNA